MPFFNPQPPPAVVYQIERDTAGDTANRTQQESLTLEREITQRTRSLKDLFGLATQSEFATTVHDGAVAEAACIARALAILTEAHTNAFPIGRTLGVVSFDGSTAKLTTTELASIESVACKLLGLRDPSHLTSHEAKALLHVNRGATPEVLAALHSLVERTQLRDLPTAPGTQDDGAPHPLLENGSVFILPKGISHAIRAEVTALQEATGQKILARIEASGATNSVLVPRVKETCDGLAVSRILLSESALAWRGDHLSTLRATEITQPDVPLRYTLSGEVSSSLQETLGAYSDLIRNVQVTYSRLNESNSKVVFSSKERDEVITRIEASRDRFLSSGMETSLAKGLLHALQSPSSLAIDSFIESHAYGKQITELSSDAETVAASRVAEESIRASISSLVVKEVASAAPSEISSHSSSILEQVRQLLPSGEAERSVLDALQAVKGSVFLQPPSASKHSEISTLEKVERSLQAEMLDRVGVDLKDVRTFAQDTLALLSLRQRHALEQTLGDALLEASSRGQSELSSSLTGALVALSKIGDDKADSENTLLSSVVSIASQVNAHSLLYNSCCDIILGGSSDSHAALASSQSERSKMRRLMHLDTWLEGESSRVYNQLSDARSRAALLDTTDPSRADLLAQILYLDKLLSRCSAVREGNTVQALYLTSSSEDRLMLFARYEKMSQTSFGQEEARLIELRGKRDLLAASLQEKKEVDTLPSIRARTLLTGPLLTLDAEIHRLELSITANKLHLAKIALQVGEPALIEKARQLLDAVRLSEAGGSSARALLRAFESQHLSDSQLIAAMKQFLFESVRDIPLYTYALMLLSGSSAAALLLLTKRHPALGFAGGSIAALGAVKTLCITTGLERVQAAYAHSLTFSTPASASLDAFYLWNDAAQLLLLVGATRALLHRTRAPEDAPREKVSALKQVATELRAWPRLVFSTFNPITNPFSALSVAVPVIAGTYTIYTAGMKPEEEARQLFELGSSVLVTLGVALLYERVSQRVKPPDEAKTTSSVPAPT